MKKIQSSDSFMYRFRNRITRLFTKKQKNQKLIEVFDVIIKSKCRLSLFHLNSGQEYICNPEVSDYLKRMDLKFITSQNAEDSVYVMDIDKSLYDPRNAEFVQVHCFRFEIDRSTKGAKQGNQGVKITDIDYYLEGNRHAKANSEELYK